MNFISNIKANLGGTEMLLMLDDLFQDEIKIGSQRQIFIITDGEVYERSKVIQKVEENSYDSLYPLYSDKVHKLDLLSMFFLFAHHFCYSRMNK